MVGRHVLILMADAGNVVAEGIETNNSLMSFPVTAIAPGMADLSNAGLSAAYTSLVCLIYRPLASLRFGKLLQNKR